jgi:hypothetical protein
MGKALSTPSKQVYYKTESREIEIRSVKKIRIENVEEAQDFHSNNPLSNQSFEFKNFKELYEKEAELEEGKSNYSSCYQQSIALKKIDICPQTKTINLK